MLAPVASPELEEEAEVLGKAASPELEELAAVLADAVESDVVKHGRFIFRIWSISDSDRVRALSLKRFALAWALFSDLMTLRRSSRMR